jgi:hypothetical protein
MNFSNFVRTESGNQILFKNSVSIDNVGVIKFYKDNASGSFSKKEFRWSFNNSYWSSWEILNQGNLTNTSINGPCLFIEIRYIKANAAAKVTSFSIGYEEAKETKTTTSSTDDTSSPKQSNLVSCKDVKDESCGVGKTTLSSCDLLDGQPGSYYLWRPNHKGTQTISTINGLQEILANLSYSINAITGDNVAGDGVGVFYQKIDNTLVFKRIKGNPGVTITESNGIITINVDASIIGKDPSIQELFDLNDELTSTVTDLSIYIDNKFFQIDASLEDLYLKDLSSLKYATNVGLNDPSISGQIFNGVIDSCIQFRSLVSGNPFITIQTAGDNVILNVDSSLGYTTHEYVDASLVARDLSINQLYQITNYLDISIAYLDSSIQQLFSLVGDSSIKGAINIGDGSAAVFAGLDSSQNLQFREIVGAGPVIVSQVGDLIYIDACTGGGTGSINTASNVPGGDASIFSMKVLQDLVFKSFKSADSSLLTITSDSSYVYFESKALPDFDILDGGNNWMNPNQNQVMGGGW